MTATTQRMTTQGRTLHLVDLENLIGDPAAKGPIVGETYARYRSLAGWRRGDQSVVAANPSLLGELAFVVDPLVALRVARGEDGADLHLLAAAPPEWVAKRFGRLVIGSGDHIFARRARTIRDLGVQVTVVSRIDALAGALQGQGFGIRALAPPVAREVACAA